MLHVGIDMHKRFSELVVLDDDRVVLERCRLDHRDRAGLERYFRQLARPLVSLARPMSRLGSPESYTAMCPQEDE